MITRWDWESSEGDLDRRRLVELERLPRGEVAEWLKAPVSKTGIPFWGIAGSNPALSAIFAA